MRRGGSDSIMAAANASSGEEDNVMRAVFVMAACIQSLGFFFQK